jgi:murein DD-endopeptidase MepM/ murein hydrolase activator NlpD
MRGFLRTSRTSAPDPAPRPHRRPRPFAVLLLCVPMFLGMLGTPVATADDLSDALAKQKALQAKIASQKRQVQQLGQQQTALRARIAQTSKNLDQANANLVEIQGEVDTLTANVALTKASYQDLVNQLKSIDGQANALANEEIRRQKALIARKALLADRIRAAYAESNTSLLEILLSSASFTDALSEVGYYLDIGTQDQALAQQIVQDVRDVAALHQAVMSVWADTQDLRGLVADQKKELDGDLSDLKAAQAKLRTIQQRISDQLGNEQGDYQRLAANKTSLAAAIKKATAAKAALAKRIDKLKAAQRQAGRIPSVYNGTLQWPMAGNISQDFGCTGVVFEPPLGSCPHFHQGIDLVAPYGTPVHASGPGTVLYVGWNYADGYDPAWIVIVAHSSSLETWYAHLQPTYPVHAGQSVSAGQLIGYEGNTGHSTGAHLHWAVRFNGAFVNPRLFV